VAGKKIGDGKTHGDMTIVSTRMHLSRILGAVGNVALLAHGKGVHVKTKQEGRARTVTAEEANDPRLGDARSYLKAKPVKLARDDARRPRFFKAKFGMLMEVTAPAHHLRKKVVCFQFEVDHDLICRRYP
jgi:hypothetical protein